jgi:hypothetical protein
VITSGGGFSTYFGVPSWQKKSVDYYFNNLKSTQKPKQGYNPQGRGFPDISLIGVNYQVVIGGTIQGLYGTSCTAPVLAAYVSLVNSERLLQNKSSIGWINPTLYAVGYNNTMNYANIYNAKLNDITSGNNSCCASSTASAADCCSSGFAATKGWDPVTGLGSVNFTEFVKIFNPTTTTSIVIVADDDDGEGGGGSSSSTQSTSGSNQLSTTDQAVTAVMVILLVIAISTLVYCYRHRLFGSKDNFSNVTTTANTNKPPTIETTHTTEMNTTSSTSAAVNIQPSAPPFSPPNRSPNVMNISNPLRPPDSPNTRTQTSTTATATTTSSSSAATTSAPPPRGGRMENKRSGSVERIERLQMTENPNASNLLAARNSRRPSQNTISDPTNPPGKPAKPPRNVQRADDYL